MIVINRRWLNGTACGYVWTYGQLDTIMQSEHSMWRKVAIVLMLVMQLLTTAVMSLGVGIFTSILFSSTHSVCSQFKQVQEAVGSSALKIMQPTLEHNSYTVATGCTVFYLLCYLLFLFVHRVKGGKDFVGWAW